MIKLVVVVSICTGAEEVASWIGDGEDGVTDGETTGEGVEDGETTGEVVPDSIGEGVEDGEATGEGVEDGETTGEVVPDSIGEGVEEGETTGEGVEDGVVVPDSIGEGAEGVTEGDTWGAVERGGLTGLEGTITGELLWAGGLDAGGEGGEQLDDGAGTQLKSIPTTPIGAFGPEGELG